MNKKIVSSVTDEHTQEFRTIIDVHNSFLSNLGKTTVDNVISVITCNNM